MTTLRICTDSVAIDMALPLPTRPAHDAAPEPLFTLNVPQGVHPSRPHPAPLHLAPVNQLVYEHEGKRVEIRLTGRPVSMGRSPEADHQLPSKAASRIHAQVFQRENAWFVEDLGSSNGTLLNGSKIEGPTALKPGDVITLADIKLKYDGEAPKPKGPPDHLIARLIYTAQPGAAPKEFLIRDRVTIGRKPGNTLVIDLKAISSQHCEVVNRGGAYVVRDLGSSNGTFVGESQVTEQTLRNGDVLIVGKAVKVYFIDPAGPSSTEAPPAQKAAAPAAPAGPQPAGAAPALPAKKSSGSGRQAPSSAAGASDRGSFEAISVVDGHKSVGPNPLPHLAVGLGLGLLFFFSGWLLSGLITDARKPKPPVDDWAPPVAALGDAALSFEGAVDGRGNPEGWTASFEAPNKAKAELLADPEHPFDGERSLRITTTELGSAVAGLTLQTTQARNVDFGARMLGSLRLRGEGVGTAALAVSILGEKGEVRSLAVTRLPDIKAVAWTEFSFQAAFLEPLPKSARLRVMLSANFSRLWIDRLELKKADDAPAIKPFAALPESELRLNLQRNMASELAVSNARNLDARFSPRLLAADNRTLSESDLWCTAQVTSDVVTYRGLLPSRGETRAIELRAEQRKSDYLPEAGIRLTWKMVERGGSNLALDVVLPLPDAATIVLADRRGAPLVVDRNALHAYPYSTVSELAVNETDFTLAFPQGAVVWLDFSRRNQLGLTLRSAPDSARDSMTIDVFTKPVMFARLYERLFKEGERLYETRNYSAAEARFAWLTSTSRAQRELPVIGRAQDRMRDIAQARTKLAERVDAAWLVVQTTRTRKTLEECERLLRQYIAEFRGDEAAATYRENLAQVEKWLKDAAVSKRTPEEQKLAESIARGLVEAASAKLKEGNLLIALLMAENVVRDYADTGAFREAQSMVEDIGKKLADPATRDKEIDAQLAKIDEEIKFENYPLARKLCNELFKRFPDTPRSRDIMLRVRKIENAFEGG